MTSPAVFFREQIVPDLRSNCAEGSVSEQYKLDLKEGRMYWGKR